jgi:uncharacterized protein YggT (Ycf19 family)
MMFPKFAHRFQLQKPTACPLIRRGWMPPIFGIDLSVILAFVVIQAPSYARWSVCWFSILDSREEI